MRRLVAALWIAAEIVLLAVIAALLCRPAVVTMIIGALAGSPPRAIAVVVLVAFASSIPRRRRPLALIVMFAAAALALETLAIDIRPVRTRTIRYDSAGATMAATLFAPRRSASAPGLVVVPGSAAVPRGLYDYWARRLAREGFVVLVADKRGVGGSGGELERRNNTSRKNLDVLANDVVAAVAALAQQPEVAGAQIGVFGISQGGWTGVIAAQRSPLVRFMVFICGPVVSVGEENLWSELMGDEHGAQRVSFAEAERRVQAARPRGFDPRPVIENLDVPGLWMFGAADGSGPTRASVDVLQVLAQRGRPFSWRVLPGCGHLLLRKPIPAMSRDMWPLVTTWLRRAAANRQKV